MQSKFQNHFNIPVNMKLLLNMLIAFLTIIGLFFAASTLSLMTSITEMPLTKCGPSPKFLYNSSRVSDIQKEFGSRIQSASIHPNSIDIISFRCGGFQDKYFNTEFTVDDEVAKMLLSTMENSYLNESPRDGEYPFSVNMAEKTKKQWRDLNNIYIEYKLPSYGGYYVKEVIIKTPINSPDARTHLNLKSYTW